MQSEVMMTRLLHSLVCGLVVGTYSITGYAYANGQSDVHIVFAFDQSESMFNDVDTPTHAEIQADALRTFLDRYDETCVSITVDFLPWGTTAGPSIQSVVRSPRDAEHFWEKVASSTTAMRSSTNHSVAFQSALELFTDPTVTNILVFTTDEATGRLEGYLLNQWVPPFVTVYGISLGNDSVYQYVEKNIVVKGKNHFHATNSAEFETALHDVMQTIANKFCLY